MTPGFSGADLANAALLAARRQGAGVTFADFEAAIERVLGGLEQRSRVMNPERQTVAYHECGHALVASLVPTGDPVSKISIILRSRGSLGYTMQMPKEDRALLSIEELEDQIAVMMGGRAAEQVMLGTISTGAVDDIQRATQLARRMVTEFGMSEKLGSVRYAGQRLQYWERGRRGQRRQRRDARDDRCRSAPHCRRAVRTGRTLVAAHRDALSQLSAELLKAESLDGSAVRAALSSAAQRPSRHEHRTRLRRIAPSIDAAPAGRQRYCGLRPRIPTGSASPTRWRDMA